MSETDYKRLTSALPDEPGVYLMKDSAGAVIYVGKALSLKKRVTSYFTKKDHDPKTALLVRLIDNIEFIATDNEIEALILENTLIKKNKPRFNIRLKDDKRYPYICVTLEDRYPRLIYTRNTRPGRQRCFGPYTDAKSAKAIASMINDLFMLKRCARLLPLNTGERPCLNFQMKKCSGACTGKISEEEYGALIEGAIKFLEGDVNPVIENIKREMARHSKNREYEKAAVYRDIIFGIQSISEKQKVYSHSGLDQDCAAVKLFGDEAVAVLFEFRLGVLLGRKISVFANAEHSLESELIETFIIEYYSRSEIPVKIILKKRPQGAELLERFLAGRSGKRVVIASAVSEDERGIIKLIEKNIDLIQSDRDASKKYHNPAEALIELMERLNLPAIPENIECFDISNLQGADSAASMVSFKTGIPHRSSYRRFKIKAYNSANDPAMIHEAVARRIQRLANEQLPMPDLILIDGGPAQLARAMEAAKNFDCVSKIISIAKRFEEIYVDPKKAPVRLPEGSNGLKLLQAIRDEAHRFAVTYHRKLRDRKTVKSVLDDIPDIGIAVKKILLKEFQSIDSIKQMSVEGLASARGIGETTARKIFDFFHK